MTDLRVRSWPPAVAFNALWFYAATGCGLLKEDADRRAASGISRSYLPGPSTTWSPRRWRWPAPEPASRCTSRSWSLRVENSVFGRAGLGTATSRSFEMSSRVEGEQGGREGHCAGSGRAVRGRAGSGEPGPAPGDDQGVRAADDGRRRRGVVRGGVWGGQPGAGELPQRVPAAGMGHPGRDDRAGDPEAAAGLVLPGVAAGAPPPRRAGAGHGRGDVVSAGGLDPAGGEASGVAGGDEAVEVAGQRDGGGAG